MYGLKLYFDYMTAPSRAVYIFLKKNNIAFDKKITFMARGDNKKPDYIANINRFGDVPAITDDGHSIIETVAILRYLARKYKVPDHWYPKDLRKQAKIDEYLEWQHRGPKNQINTYFYYLFVRPVETHKAVNKKTAADLGKATYSALDKIENVWLKDTPYLAGNSISIADLLGSTEMEQTKVLGFDPAAGRPKISAWLSRVSQDLNPHYDEANNAMKELMEEIRSQNPVEEPSYKKKYKKVLSIVEKLRSKF